MTDPVPAHPGQPGAADQRAEADTAPTALGYAPGPGSRSAPVVAEALGSFLLVLTAVAATLFTIDLGTAPNGAPFGGGILGVALAAGLAFTAAAYAFGPVSGGHFTPAVTVGLAAAGRFPWSRVGEYVLGQILGALVATTLLVLVGTFGPEGWLASVQDRGFASNGWGPLSPGGFQIGGAIVVEVVFTGLFLLTYLGVTHRRRGAPAIAGLVAGLAFSAAHIATFGVDGASLNPARSIATAIYGGGAALAQSWVFLVFPLVGAALAGIAYRGLFDGEGKASVSRRPPA